MSQNVLQATLAFLYSTPTYYKTPFKMADEIRYKPSQIAEMFDVSANTVRNWSRWHGAHLDDAATPGMGATRLFSARDVQVLKQVNELRTAGLTTDEINERLAGMRFPVVTQDVTDVEPEFSPPAPVESAETLLPVLRDVVDQKQRIDAIDTRLRAVERRSSEWKALAIVLGLFALGLFLLMLYSLM